MSDFRDDAKTVICEIVAAARGPFCGTVRLFQAFYFAHLYYWQRAGRPLTDCPIVRMPNGPGIDGGTDMLQELALDGRTAIDFRQTGPYRETVYRVSGPVEPAANEDRRQAIQDAVDFTAKHSAAELSELTHEYSRSWRAANDGEELNVYLDLLDDAEYARLQSRTWDAQALVEGAFGGSSITTYSPARSRFWRIRPDSCRCPIRCLHWGRH